MILPWDLSLNEKHLLNHLNIRWNTHHEFVYYGKKKLSTKVKQEVLGRTNLLISLI
jgi:hypothetical protein